MSHPSSSRWFNSSLGHKRTKALGAVVRANRQAGRRLLHVEQLENQRMLSGGLQADLGHRQSQLSDGSCAFHFEPFEGTLDQWGESLRRFRIAKSSKHRSGFVSWPNRRAPSPSLPFSRIAVTPLATLPAWSYTNSACRYWLAVCGLDHGLHGFQPDAGGSGMLPRLKALVHYAFHDLGCVHLELANSQVGREDAEKIWVSDIGVSQPRGRSHPG